MEKKLKDIYISHLLLDPRLLADDRRDCRHIVASNGSLAFDARAAVSVVAGIIPHLPETALYGEEGLRIGKFCWAIDGDYARKIIDIAGSR